MDIRTEQINKLIPGTTTLAHWHLFNLVVEIDEELGTIVVCSGCGEQRKLVSKVIPKAEEGGENK